MSTSKTKAAQDVSDRAAVHKQNLSDAQDALAAEFQALVSDTEALLKATAKGATEQSEELRNALTEKLEHAKGLFKEKEESVREQSRAAIQATESYVQEKPWQSVGIAAGVGFLLGMLVSRR